MSVEKLKYWCHKILPLVYDESLSYYEVLCKMKATINEVITVLNQIAETVDSLEDLTAEVVQQYITDHPEIISNAVSTFITQNPEVVEAAVLTEITAHPEWIGEAVGEYLADNLHIPFYNVSDYDILPNTDIYESLHDLLKNKVVNTGGVVYFPRGKYTLSYTIFIPENTTFIGEGELTEIYFDETDTTIGVGLANGGSNVTIKNMKVSHKSTGTFSSGARPGAIAFSDTTAENVTESLYSTSVHRGDVKNLTAENIVFAGNYAIQTENSQYHTIENVTYKNLYAPNSCVSVAPCNQINNVIIENVTCDLLRIYDNHKILNRTGVKRLFCENTTANTLYVSDYYNKYENDFMFVNFKQSSGTKNNDVLSSATSVGLNCNITFINSSFYSRASETDGITIYYGTMKFINCYIYGYSKVFSPMVSITEDESYALIFEECTIRNRAANPTSTTLVGYGKNNTIIGSNIIRRLWGDMNDYYTVFENVSESTHLNKVIINNESVLLNVYTVITNGTIAQYPARLAQFPCVFNNVPCVIWNSEDRAGTELNTYLNIDNGDIVIGEPNVSAADYDRLMIHASLPVTATPTPKQVYNLLH